jgi:hypothetical protein
MTTHARPRRGRRALIITGAVIAAAAVFSGGVALGAAQTGSAPAATAPTGSHTSAATATPTPTPLTATQQLLQDSGDPNACAVSFRGEGIAEAPVVESAGARYAHLPIPAQDGGVFAGWYATPEAAATRDTASRINGADAVACGPEHEVTLHGAWTTAEDLAATGTRVPILMYHQFTDKPEGEEGWLRNNFYGVTDWQNDLAYIRDGGFYLPTWDELSAFIDGRLFLPPRSVIITDDDADSTWLNWAVPVVDQDQLLTTSFVITSARQDPTPSIWVQQRSHTHAMHEAGENGKGRMVNWSEADIAADLQTSAQILGATEVIAYPYGHYNDTAKAGVAAAGFEMAVTTEWGYVTVGSDKLALPRVRMNWGMTVDDLAGMIG